MVNEKLRESVVEATTLHHGFSLKSARVFHVKSGFVVCYPCFSCFFSIFLHMVSETVWFSLVLFLLLHCNLVHFFVRRLFIKTVSLLGQFYHCRKIVIAWNLLVWRCLNLPDVGVPLFLSKCSVPLLFRDFVVCSPDHWHGFAARWLFRRCGSTVRLPVHRYGSDVCCLSFGVVLPMLSSAGCT